MAKEEEKKAKKAAKPSKPAAKKAKPAAKKPTKKVSKPKDDVDDIDGEDAVESLDSIKKRLLKKAKADGNEIEQAEIDEAVSFLDLTDDDVAGLIEFFRSNKINVISDDDEEGIDKLVKYIRSYKTQGFGVAIKLDNASLELSSKFYGYFDFFIIPTKSFLNGNLEVSIPVFKGVIESLLKYNKPIISIEIPSWDVVELVYKFGVNIICGNAIATANENLLPLDRKTLIKLKKLEE